MNGALNKLLNIFPHIGQIFSCLSFFYQILSIIRFTRRVKFLTKSKSSKISVLLFSSWTKFQFLVHFFVWFLSRIPLTTRSKFLTWAKSSKSTVIFLKSVTTCFTWSSQKTKNNKKKIRQMRWNNCPTFFEKVLYCKFIKKWDYMFHLIFSLKTKKK